MRTLDEQTFDAYVAEPTVVAFVRPRHPAGRELAELLEVLEVLALRHGPRVGVVLVDVHDNPTLAERFAITDVPTVILFDDYRSRGRLGPAITLAALDQLVADRLA